MIGADGKNSVARKVLVGEEQDAEEDDSQDTNDLERSVLPPMKEITGLVVLSYSFLLVGAHLLLRYPHLLTSSKF